MYSSLVKHLIKVWAIPTHTRIIEFIDSCGYLYYYYLKIAVSCDCYTSILVCRRSESPLPPLSSSSASGVGVVPPPAGTVGSNPYRFGGSKKTMVYATPAYTQPIVQSTAPPLVSGPPPTHEAGYQGSVLPPPTGSQPTPSYQSGAPPTDPAHSGLITGSQPSVAPIHPHWFYLKNNQKYWFPFNKLESSKLDEAYLRCLADSSYRVSSM